MIKNVQIVPYSKIDKSELEDDIEKLWPTRKKAIKIFANPDVSHYKIKVYSLLKSDDFKITLNNFEIIPLKLINESNGIYQYHSDKLSARSFLGFNLGLLELSLFDGFENFRLSTLNNKQGLLGNEEIGYIYESVACSQFFSFYIAHYFRANAPSKQVEFESENKHFWIRIAIASELLIEISKFLNGELDFVSRVHSSSQVKKFSRSSIIEDRDIHWLMENPNEMFISEYGDIPYLGLQYDIDFISQSITSIDFDTYENRLIISCLYSIQSSIDELIIDLSDDNFPHQSVSKILDDTNSLISSINSQLNLLPPFRTRPEFSNKYFDDVRYARLFELITKWFSLNDLTYGTESKSPILSITDIFEHYCFIKIIESLEINGFNVDSILLKDLDTAGTVTLRREDETVSIYYEPIVSVTEFSPLKCSKKVTHFHPDIVIIYENNTSIKCGVIDPKFAIENLVRKELAPHIFYKYGLFFHRPDGHPIDFVYAMYPDLNKKSKAFNYRSELVSFEVTPALGDFSIPFHSQSAELMSDFLNVLITDKM